MPRDIAGNYTLPAGNPVVPNTIISTNWANTTLDDVAQALTQSLSIDGSVTTAKIADDAVTPPKLNGQDVDGIVARISSTEFEGRAVAGTANQISVTNGDGVSGNPTIGFASSPHIPGPEVRILGSGTGAANNAYLTFYESNGTVRRGYVGDGTATNNLQLAAEVGDLELSSTTNVRINGGVAYHQGNILGAVSQSGGVPTGAIIERGSNASGTYIKFADGTMICRRSISITETVLVAFGSVYVAGAPVTYSTPATFSTAPQVTATLHGSGKAHWLGSDNAPSTTTFGGYYNISPIPEGSFTYTLSLVAVGQWF